MHIPMLLNKSYWEDCKAIRGSSEAMLGESIADRILAITFGFCQGTVRMSLKPFNKMTLALRIRPPLRSQAATRTQPRARRSHKASWRLSRMVNVEGTFYISIFAKLFVREKFSRANFRQPVNTPKKGLVLLGLCWALPFEQPSVAILIASWRNVSHTSIVISLITINPGNSTQMSSAACLILQGICL